MNDAKVRTHLQLILILNYNGFQKRFCLFTKK